MSARAERLHLRLDSQEMALLEAASRAAPVDVSTFVLNAAIQAAVDVVADRCVFTLDEEALRMFDGAPTRPARDVAESCWPHRRCSTSRRWRTCDTLPVGELEG